MTLELNPQDEIDCLRKQIKNMVFENTCITEKHMIHIQKLIAENNHMRHTYTCFKTSYDYLSHKCYRQEKEYDVIKNNNSTLLNVNEHINSEVNIQSYKVIKLKEEISTLHILNNETNKTNETLLNMFHVLENKIKTKHCIHILGRSIFLYSLYLNMYYVPYPFLNGSIFILGGLSVFF